MEIETKTSLQVVRMKFVCIGPFLQFSSVFGAMFIGLHQFV